MPGAAATLFPPASGELKATNRSFSPPPVTNITAVAIPAGGPVTDPGEVAERLNAPVSKTGIRLSADREFESLPLRLRKYFVYILQSESDSGYYIGYTSNLVRRIREHNSGKTRSLKHRRPLRLVYFEEYSSKSDAEAREKQIKSWKGGAAFKQLLVESSPRC